MCGIPREGVIVLVQSRTIGQTSTACEWFARAARAVRDVIDETPGGALVVHRSDLQGIVDDEDHEFTAMRMKGLSLALRARVGLRTAAYRVDCNEVIVIFDPERISLERAREASPRRGYAPQVRAALA